MLRGKASPEAKREVPILAGGENEGLDSSLLIDNFVSQLGAVISLSIRHLVVPPTPLFSIQYSERVTFHLFFIQNHQVSLHRLLILI